ncbi:MAG TPA: hypothetical protein VIS76_15620, partial [Pseudomonadales bacterium]
RLPADLQAAIVQAGKDAGTYGRVIELTEGDAKLAKMQGEGKLETNAFTERERLIEAAKPVLKSFFENNDAGALYEAIQAVQ